MLIVAKTAGLVIRECDAEKNAGVVADFGAFGGGERVAGVLGASPYSLAVGGSYPA